MKTIRVVVALVPLAVSAVLALSGCVSRIDLSYDVLDPGSTPEQALPALTLTRRVVPLRGKQRTAMWAGWNEVDAESRSRFGAAGEVADPRCIVDGIQAAFPAAVIVPTPRFWSEVAPGRETVALEDVFQEPIWTRLRSLPADVLIAALAGSPREPVPPAGSPACRHVSYPARAAATPFACFAS